MLLPDLRQGLCLIFGFRIFLPAFVFHPRGATAMKTTLYKSGAAIAFVVLWSAAALAKTNEENVLTILGEVQMYVFIAFVIIVFAAVAFMKSRDKRQTPLNKIFDESEAIHSVGPDTPVTECVRLMTVGKIGALIVMDGDRLIGIFTERDALNRPGL
jgi:DNA integrity scanning protein DisA with diadenylate cyclase activity